MSIEDRADPPPALLAPEPGWVELENHSPLPRYVSGETDSDRLRVRYYRRSEDGALVGKAWFGPGTEGPPGHAHGGSMAALLDEVMGVAAWIAGHSVVAARIEINFRNMLPLGTVTTFEGHVHEINGRKVTSRGRILGPDNHVFAQGQGLFLKLDAEYLKELQRKNDPEA